MSLIIFCLSLGLCCVGAIDGTHIPAWVRLEDQVRYRNRKSFLSQNVMAVVSFDMRFQYVFAGWEGSAFDSKILQDALWRRPYNRLQVPIGKFQFTSSRNKEYFIFVW